MLHRQSQMGTFRPSCFTHTRDDMHHAQNHCCTAALWPIRSLTVQLAELDAQKHAGLVKSVADDITDFLGFRITVLCKGTYNAVY